MSKPVFIDTEFVSNGSVILPLSIGIAKSADDTFYAVPPDVEHLINQIEQKAEAPIGDDDTPPWLEKNVLPYIFSPHTPFRPKTSKELCDAITDYVGDDPQFSAYVASYDWVVLRQLFSTLALGPRKWPYGICELSLAMKIAGKSSKDYPYGEGVIEHNALNDALWGLGVYEDLMNSCTIMSTMNQEEIQRAHTLRTVLTTNVR